MAYIDLTFILYLKNQKSSLREILASNSSARIKWATLHSKCLGVINHKLCEFGEYKPELPTDQHGLGFRGVFT